MVALEDFEYFRTDLGTLYYGDCLEILPLLEDESVDLVLTDPPYGINHNPNWQKQFGKSKYYPNATYDTIINDDGNLDLSFLKKFPQRVVFGFPYLNDESAKGWLVWLKGEQKGLTSQVEMAYSTCWTGFKVIKNLWIGYWKENNEKRLPHPNQKPIKVMKWLANRTSNDGAIILDPFCGSGTTAVACEELQRRWIGIEISEEYCEIAKKRLEIWKGQQRWF